MSALHSINEDQRLYVLHAGKGGVTCLGFDVVERRALAVGNWLVEQPSAQKTGAARDAATWLDCLTRETKGSADYFQIYANIMERAQIHASVFGPCLAELVPALVGKEGKRVEAVVNGERKRFKVGRSTGWLPCHLMLHNRRSRGGDAVMSYEIKDVRIID